LEEIDETLSSTGITFTGDVVEDLHAAELRKILSPSEYDGNRTR